MNIQIDTKATLQKFTEKEIRITDYCRTRRFCRRHFYALIKNQAGKTRNAFEGKKIRSALQADGLLVLEKDRSEEDNLKNRGW